MAEQNLTGAQRNLLVGGCSKEQFVVFERSLFWELPDFREPDIIKHVKIAFL